jgi:hypothetical protein
MENLFIETLSKISPPENMVKIDYIKKDDVLFERFLVFHQGDLSICYFGFKENSPIKYYEKLKTSEISEYKDYIKKLLDQTVLFVDTISRQMEIYIERQKQNDELRRLLKRFLKDK